MACELNSPPPLAWPSRRNLRINMALSLFFLFFFNGLYGLSNYVTGLHSFRLHLYFAFETRIPLVPAMAAVYLSISPLLMMAPFVFRTPREIAPLLLTLCSETVIAVPFFLLLPAANGFPAGNPADFHESAGLLLRFANAVKLDWNLIPSLHATFAVTALLAYRPRFRKRGRILLIIWASAIVLSTLLIHAHHLVDLAAGIALAFFSMRAIHAPLSEQDKLESIAIEFLMLRKFAFSSRRRRGASPIHAAIRGQARRESQE